jgi:hypothetical protein
LQATCYWHRWTKGGSMSCAAGSACKGVVKVKLRKLAAKVVGAELELKRKL